MISKFSTIKMFILPLTRLSSCDNTGHSVTSNGGNGGNLSFEFAKGRQLGAALTSLYFLVETGRWEIRKSADDLVRRAFGKGMLIHCFCFLLTRVYCSCIRAWDIAVLERPDSEASMG